MSDRHNIDWKKVGALVPQQLPDAIRSLSPQLTAFIASYYEWMDQKGQPNHALANLRNYRDIDRTLEEFVDFFHDEYLERLPKTLVCDRRHLIKHIIDFYRAAGNKKSIRFLFRILFDEDIDFYIPGQDILRLSDGKWQVDKSLKVTLLDPSFNINDFTSAEIIGSSSGARSRVETVVQTMSDQMPVVELFVARIIGAFQANELILLDGLPVATVDSHGLYTYPGRYLNTDGFLSSDKRLQDNFYYQEFSYVIKAGRSLDQYASILKGLVHPAGTIMFGEIQLVQDAGLPVPSVETSWCTISASQDNYVDLVPKVITSVTSGTAADIDSMLSFEGWVLENPTWTVSLTKLAGTQVTGTVRLSTSSVISAQTGIPISSLVGWVPDTFTDGTGVLATGANFISALAADQIITWRDLDGIVTDAYNEIRTISGASALILKFKPNQTVTHPAIIT